MYSLKMFEAVGQCFCRPYHVVDRSFASSWLTHRGFSIKMRTLWEERTGWNSIKKKREKEK